LWPLVTNVEWSGVVSNESSRAVEWDGATLVGWVTIDGKPTKVSATRDMIHSHAAGFNDAVSWEIDKYRAEIFEKVAPVLIAANSK
jgi:hypothetical protein